MGNKGNMPLLQKRSTTSWAALARLQPDQFRKGTVSLYLALVRPQLEHFVSKLRQGAENRNCLG